jgi:hypothetical protein
MGFALVVLDHGYGPCFEVDGSALRGLQEGIGFLLCFSMLQMGIPSGRTYV